MKEEECSRSIYGTGVPQFRCNYDMQNSKTSGHMNTSPVETSVYAT